MQANCKDNLQVLKKAFKSVDRPLLDNSILPGFEYFTRIRLRCGNRDEVMRIGTVREYIQLIGG